jgi:hypothetical protein
MKHVILIFILCFAALPGWSARKITVSQLEEMLRSLQQNKKTDIEIATALEQVELSQELTRKRMNELIGLAPGPMSTEQFYVLEGRSAVLAPPGDDLPTDPAPDAGAQKNIVEKASSYVASKYDMLPMVSATKTTLRFQDNMQAVSSASGLQSGATDVVTSAGFSNPATFVHYINSTEGRILSAHGAEKASTEKDGIPWGANKMITLREPDPSLGVVFREAESTGTFHWLRWERVDGSLVAVYSFTVPTKNSKMSLDICCFPNVKQAGVANFYTAVTAPTLGGGGGGGGGGVSGNFQTSTDWHPFAKTVPYHGEIFIQPNTGMVVRMITQAELKPSDVVHQADTRIDFGPAKVGDRVLTVPLKAYVNTEVVPSGDSGAGTYSTRHTLFTSEFKDYQLSGSK